MKVGLTLAVCVLGLTLNSATTAAAGSTCAVRKQALQLSEADAGRTVRVACGTPIVLTAQNYAGRWAQSSATGVVRVGAIKTVGPPVGGSDSYHFATLRPGLATVYIHRGLPFGLPSPLPEPFDFRIIVKVYR
jgi:hypothetical protein